MSERKSLNADELRGILYENLTALCEGRVTPGDANARARQIREIVRLYQLQMRGLSQLSQEMTTEIKDFLQAKA